MRPGNDFRKNSSLFTRLSIKASRPENTHKIIGLNRESNLMNGEPRWKEIGEFFGFRISFL